MAVDPKTLKVGDTYLAPIGYEDESGTRERKVVAAFFDHVVLADGLMPILNTDEYWSKCEYSMTDLDISTAAFIKTVNDFNGVKLGHPRFLALLDELRSMHLAKSADYGTDDDCYANYRKTASLGINPSMGILIRMADKWSRIETWANGGTLCNEGVKDSLMDLAGYALAAITMIEEEDAKK